MIDFSEQANVKVPVTYQEWLDCLAVLKGTNVHSSGVYEALIAGSFTGTDMIRAALQRQIIDAINVMLDHSTQRFIRELNTRIIFNELYRMDLLFKRLKKDVKIALFFEELEFLPQNFKNKLSASVRQQMSNFWDKTVNFLYEQLSECSNSDLADTLFLIKQIKLFE